MSEERIFKSEDGNIILEISEEGILANLTILDNGTIIDEKTILDLLDKANIKHGVDKAVSFLNENEVNKEFNEPFVVALSIEPEHQANISYFFDLQNTFNPQTFHDITDLENLVSVSKEQPLAEFTEDELDKSNVDIFGNEVKPAFNKNQIIHNYLGENVYYSVYKQQIMSSRTGYPYLDENKRINVRSEFKIEGDLEGVNINMCGNLLVEGNIIDSEINLEGNLLVTNNLINCRGTGIVVNGNIDIKGAENSNIACTGHLKLDKSLRLCQVAVAGGIIGSDESSIIGGLAQSGTSIEVATVGNPFSVFTDLEIAISPYLKTQIQLLKNQIRGMKKKSDMNSKRTKVLLEKISDLEKEYENQIMEHLENENSERFIKIKKKAFPQLNLRILGRNRSFSREMKSFTLNTKEKELTINES
jgi:hypothetical protein